MFVPKFRLMFSFESLQQTALGTVRDTPVGGSSIFSAFENLGLNLAAGLGSVGISKLEQVAGVSPRQTASGRVSLLSPSVPGYRGKSPTSNWGVFLGVVAGVIALGAFVVFAHRPKG